MDCARAALFVAARCPLCRQEVAAVVGSPDPGRPMVVVDLSGADGHAGVTLCNHSADGAVRVVRLEARDRMRNAGVARHDVFDEINGIRLNGHAQAVAIIDAATATGESVRCARRKRTQLWHQRVF